MKTFSLLLLFLPPSFPYSLLVTSRTQTSLKSTPDQPSEPSSALATQLTSAFSSLTSAQKYDVTLTALTTRITESPDPALTPNQQLQDPIRLLDEMSSKGISPGRRAAAGLLDAAASTRDTEAVSASVSALAKSQLKTSTFRSESLNIPPSPAKADLPKDERGSEVTAASLYLFSLSFCFLSNALGGLNSSYDPTVPNLAIFFLVGLVVVDNFYPAFRLLSTSFDKAPTLPPHPPHTPKGRGSVKKTHVAGLTRLTSRDNARDCLVEASALYAGYALGLPCFPFRANSLEAAAMIRSDPGGLGTEGGVARVCCWLWAGVAAEGSRYPNLVASDPREVEALFRRLGKMEGMDDVISRKEVIVGAAYERAKTLVRERRKEVGKVEEGLLSGAATVGDCVGLIEGW